MTKRRATKPMPAASMHLLLALLRGENHGYALLRLVEEQSDGSVRMGPGTLYGTLNRLLADQLIEETTSSHEPDANDRRRYYRLTGAGVTMAHAELERVRHLVRHFGDVPGTGGALA